MNKRDIAGYLGINRATLYNWEKERPNLYNTVMMGLLVDEVIDEVESKLEKLKEMRKTYNLKKSN